MLKDDVCGVYCIENSIDNKKYIGQSKNIKQRWRQHKSLLNLNLHSNIFLQRAWNKHGKDCFSFYVLEYCSPQDLDTLEVRYISEYNTQNILLGYNLDGGGISRKNFKHSDETKKKISQIQTGRKLTEDWKNNISVALKDKIKNGYTPKIENLLSANQLKMKSINCFDCNGKLIKAFENIYQAQNELNLFATNICKVLKGKSKTCGNYTFSYCDEIISQSDIIKRFHNNYDKNKKVLKVNKQGVILDVFDSITDCFNNQDDYSCYDNVKHQCTNRLKSKLAYKYIYERLYDKNLVCSYFS